MTDWLDRSECDFTLRGRFGESIGVPATSACVYPACVDPPGVPCVCMEKADRADAVSAPVTADLPKWPDDTFVPHPARPEPPDEAHEAIAEARRSIHRAITAARVARDALTLFIADADRALDELNGGGW